MHEEGTSSSGRRAFPPTVRGTEVTDPVNSIDSLLQYTFLFMMDVLHNTSLQCDNDFYCRACKLVETLKQQLKSQQASDEFSHHMLYAQCGLPDQIVLSSRTTMPGYLPHFSLSISVKYADEAIPERMKMLLRQPAPALRLLVQYQTSLPWALAAIFSVSTMSGVNLWSR